MKLFLVAGIALIFCLQFSHQLPLGTHDLKEPSSIETGAKIDSNTVDEEKSLSKRGWKNPFKDAYKHFEETVKEHIPVKRDIKDKPSAKAVIDVPSTFDLGKGVNTDDDTVDYNLEPETEGAEIQMVKRGWFKKLWNKIKNVVVGGFIGMIKRDTAAVDDDDDDLNVALSDDIIEVDLETKANNEEENEKEIEIVKRGWFKKIRRKIKNVLTGAIAGSLVGSIVKRGTKDAKPDLPLLLKTLRLRPGTADEITKIVEKLVNDSNLHDTLIGEIFNETEKDGETVLERNGKSVRCRFVRGKFICF